MLFVFPRYLPDLAISGGVPEEWTPELISIIGITNCIGMVRQALGFFAVGQFAVKNGKKNLTEPKLT